MRPVGSHCIAAHRVDDRERSHTSWVEQRHVANDDDLWFRTRTQRRQVGEGQILKVGAQFEVINPALISVDSNRVEMGLPVLISLPKGMTVSPGEFVDLSIRYAKR